MEQKTIEAWADIAIKEWEQKIQSLGISHTFALLDSFTHHIHSAAGGKPERIDFAFNYYGKFVEMRVGKGMPYDKAQSSLNMREEKPWYTRTFRAQVHRLREVLQEKYSETVSANIHEGLEGSI